MSHYNAIISLFRTLATSSNAAGIRPLVFITPGCKGYGPGALANDPDLAPQTELTPLNPQPSLVNRATYAIKTFENKDLFDTVVLRPMHVRLHILSLCDLLHIRETGEAEW